MNNLIDHSDLCNVTDIARRYGVDRKTVYNWLKDGMAPLGVTICGQHFFFISALESFNPPKRGRKAKVRH